MRLTHHIRCERRVIFTPTPHTHTHVRANMFQPGCFVFFLRSCEWVTPRSRMSSTRSVFSKTAEDSLAHVTTASRLTCYHGDKPANENSADSCDVDCELFVLRGDLFFFSPRSPPLPSPPAPLVRPFYAPHVHSDVCAHKINMARLLTPACTAQTAEASLKCK